MALDLGKEVLVEHRERGEALSPLFGVKGAELLKKGLEVFAVVVAEGVATHHLITLAHGDGDVELTVTRAVHERLVDQLQRLRGVDQVNTKRHLAILADHEGNGGGSNSRHGR